MDQKGPSKVVLKKKKTDVSLLKLTKSDTGIPRIPKTFVFDQNLPKEEYLKYINPENIIPESLEVATKVFSSYRKRIGGSGIEALNQDLPQILKPKSSLPFFDHNKSSAREIASYRENAPSYEGSVMHDTKLHVSMKKTMDKSRHDEIIQDNTLDLKGMLKDIASFSASQEHRNEGYTDGQQTSPNRAKGSLRNGDDSINLSKIKRGAQEKEKEDLTGAGQNSGKENVKKNYHHHKRSEGDIIHMMAKKKKKKVTADQYEITDLDNTQEIVRKTDVAVKTLSKRSEQVKREMKNFEENVKAKLKESESAPISSLRAVNLVRDYVFNEEEFAKLIEEEEREEEREKAQKEYNQRNQLKKKKVNLKPTESKVKGFNNTMTARFTHIPFPKASPRNDAITITKEEKKKVEHVVEQHVAIKEEELKKQVEVQMRIHEKYGVFSNENNLFRINSMNYTKLMKEKEKIRDHLLQELKHTKYKERERESKMFTAQSHRVRSIHSDRPSRQDLDYGREEDKGKDVTKKEDAKTQYINKIKEVLTKPVKDNIGSKPSELSTHVNRLYGLRKKYTTTDIEKVNQASYHNL